MNKNRLEKLNKVYEGEILGNFIVWKTVCGDWGLTELDGNTMFYATKEDALEDLQYLTK